LVARARDTTRELLVPERSVRAFAREMVVAAHGAAQERRDRHRRTQSGEMFASNQYPCEAGLRVEGEDSQRALGVERHAELRRGRQIERDVGRARDVADGEYVARPCDFVVTGFEPCGFYQEIRCIAFQVERSVER